MNSKPIIVGLGETLWDCFPDRSCLGGAPLNFACSAAELAQNDEAVHLVSAVGKDQLGTDAIQKCEEHRLNTASVQVLPHPTGRVLVELDAAGVAEYRFEDNAAWDNIEWNDELRNLASRCDAVCFGSLGQRSAVSRNTIQSFVESTDESALRVFDINLRPPHVDETIIEQSLRLANVLKLNEDELPVLSKQFQIVGDDGSILRALAKRFALRAIALTKGSFGSALLIGEDLHVADGTAVEVVDTVGAGDAFTAAVVLGMLQDFSVEQINQNASKVAAYACTQPGATMTFPPEVRSRE